MGFEAMSQSGVDGCKDSAAHARIHSIDDWKGRYNGLQLESNTLAIEKCMLRSAEEWLWPLLMHMSAVPTVHKH